MTTLRWEEVVVDGDGVQARGADGHLWLLPQNPALREMITEACVVHGLLRIGDNLAVLDITDGRGQVLSILLDLQNDGLIHPRWLDSRYVLDEASTLPSRLKAAIEPVRQNLLTDIGGSANDANVIAFMKAARDTRIGLMRLASTPELRVEQIDALSAPQRENWRRLANIDWLSLSLEMVATSTVKMPARSSLAMAEQVAFAQISVADIVVQARDHAEAPAWVACFTIRTLTGIMPRWIFFPESGVCHVRRLADGVGAAQDLNTFLSFIAAAGSDVHEWARNPIGPALYYCPRHANHLGHMIWNSLSAVEKVASVGECPGLTIYDATKTPAANLYGKLSDLFPEFSYAIYQPPSGEERLIDLFVAAVRERKHLIGLQACEVPKKLSRRIMLNAANAASPSTPSVPPPFPTVTFGLRLQDRTISELNQFYASLARNLLAVTAQGKLRLVIDGMNSSPTGEPLPTTGLVPSNALMAGEMAFVSELRERLASEPIVIISCVGYGMADNLQMMKDSTIFVAPLGGGLVKYRWAMDLPGMVLINSMNLRFSKHYDIYGQSGGIEDPSPLLYTVVDEVEDIYPEGQQFLPSGKTVEPWKGGLSNINFRLKDPQAVIDRITELYSHYAT